MSLSPSDEPTAIANARFKLLDRPHINPGHCACCGAVDRPVVDFGLTLLRFGAVLLCEFCIKQAATLVGMVPESTLKDNQRATEDIVLDYLNQHYLRLISDESYRVITDFVSGFIDVTPSGTGSVPMESTPESPKDDSNDFGQLTLFDVDDDGAVTINDSTSDGLDSVKRSDDLSDVALG